MSIVGRLRYIDQTGFSLVKALDGRSWGVARIHLPFGERGFQETKRHGGGGRL